MDVPIKPQRTELTRRPPPSFANKVGRSLWGLVYIFLFRPSPRAFHFWRRALLRLFGAKIAKGAKPYNSAKIWAPWNLEMGVNSTLGDEVDCYCVTTISIGKRASVSQRTFLCSATRDIDDADHPLMVAPIRIEDRAWVASEAYIGPGVTVGRGAVVAVRSLVLADVEPGLVVAGQPVRTLRRRNLDVS